MLSRDKAKADKAAERAAVKAEAKKAAKAAAMVATKAGATTTGKAKPEEVTPNPKKCPPEEDPADTKKTPSKKRLATDNVKDSSMFRIDHERSIPQWLLRTGWKQPFGPGPKGFRYIKGDEASETRKFNECKDFAKKICLDRGLASPAL